MLSPSRIPACATVHGPCRNLPEVHVSFGESFLGDLYKKESRTQLGVDKQGDTQMFGKSTEVEYGVWDEGLAFCRRKSWEPCAGRHGDCGFQKKSASPL